MTWNMPILHMLNPFLTLQNPLTCIRSYRKKDALILESLNLMLHTNQVLKAWFTFLKSKSQVQIIPVFLDKGQCFLGVGWGIKHKWIQVDCIFFKKPFTKNRFGLHNNHWSCQGLGESLPSPLWALAHLTNASKETSTCFPIFPSNIHTTQALPVRQSNIM